MNKTSIEWVKNPDGSQGYTWNPVTGCLNHDDNGLCKGGGFPCYAYKLAHGRVKPLYLGNTNLADGAKGGISKIVNAYQTLYINREGDYADPFYPRFWEDRLYHPWDGEPKGIFPCDMGDLFGQGIPEQWTRTVLDLIAMHKQNRYYLLTKQSQNLVKFSPFSDNCWVGVTATNAQMLREALMHLEEIKASVKYVSLEPLLEQIYKPVYFLNALPDFLSVIDWLIIGACTGTVKGMSHLFDRYPQLNVVQDGKRWAAQPRIEWVKEIVEAANQVGVKVFLKDNIDPLLRNADGQIPTGLCDNYGHTLRQELPNV